jgi:hypothetical protein
MRSAALCHVLGKHCVLMAVCFVERAVPVHTFDESSTSAGEKRAKRIVDGSCSLEQGAGSLPLELRQFAGSDLSHADSLPYATPASISVRV